MLQQSREGKPPAVTIGIDPHKSSHTAAALDLQQRVVSQVRVPATLAGYRELRRWAATWPDRRWAVENAPGLGRPLAQRLLGDGETVVDVPPKLSARVRLLSTGHGRKTDAADAVSTALAACGPLSCMRPASRAMRRLCACSRIGAMIWWPAALRC